MKIVRSADGTAIGYESQGDGPALIVVDGALSTPSTGSKPELARTLSAHFTVYSYYRRGRGVSGDTQPYAVDREIEDITALIEAAGGAANVYGHSSGASLAMKAAVAHGDQVRKLAMYEAPFNDDPQARRAWEQYISQLTEVLADGRSGDAVALFMAYTGVPPEQIDQMRGAPYWSGMEDLGATLRYDHAFIQGKDNSVPRDQAARVQVPALVMYGDASFPFMEPTAQALSAAIPGALLRALAGQDHNVSPEVLAPVLVDFFIAS